MDASTILKDEIRWFDYVVTVLDDDIDANGHANNVVYLRWIQEASAAHWFAVVKPPLTLTWTWVVVRHEIDYKKSAQRGDVLTVRTWLGEITAATTERFCEVLRQADGALLAKSRTIWCALDPATGRPKRLDPRVRSCFLGEEHTSPRSDSQADP